MASELHLLHVTTRAAWRRWLTRHHEGEREIWLVFFKRHTGESALDYSDALDEALCFGWIDSLIRRLDAARYARKFTPRKERSRWTVGNRERFEQLRAAGRVTAAGRAKAPPPLAPAEAAALEAQRKARQGEPVVPTAITRALRQNAAAWQNFRRLAPSYRRNYIAWIEAAKKDVTRRRRIAEAIALLERNEKLGMK
jgi:uncharacterized protein YdeI (YjbR/CyaY-like superfamily)